MGPDAEYDYAEPDGVFKSYMTYIGSLNTHGIAPREYAYRSRVLCDHLGRFEYQTLIPFHYFDPEDSTWRCPHIHHFIQADGHLSTVTQIMFPDMPKNDVDNHILPELTVPLVRGAGPYWVAKPQFVLAPEKLPQRYEEPGKTMLC